MYFLYLLCVFLCHVGEVQAFHEDLNGRQHINEIYKFSVDKLYDILFTESQFMSDFMEQRRFSGRYAWCSCTWFSQATSELLGKSAS